MEPTLADRDEWKVFNTKVATPNGGFLSLIFDALGKNRGKQRLPRDGLMPTRLGGTIMYSAVVASFCGLVEALSTRCSLKHAPVACSNPPCGAADQWRFANVRSDPWGSLLLWLLWLDSWGLRAHGSSHDDNIATRPL